MSSQLSTISLGPGAAIPAPSDPSRSPAHHSSGSFDHGSGNASHNSASGAVAPTSHSSGHNSAGSGNSPAPTATPKPADRQQSMFGSRKARIKKVRGPAGSGSAGEGSGSTRELNSMGSGSGSGLESSNPSERSNFTSTLTASSSGPHVSGGSQRGRRAGVALAPASAGGHDIVPAGGVHTVPEGSDPDHPKPGSPTGSSTEDEVDMVEAEAGSEIENVLSLICNIYSVPVAMVAATHANRVFLKQKGAAILEHDLVWRRSLCDMAMDPLIQGEVVVVQDASKDERLGFRDAHCVKHPPRIMFFCSSPLKSAEGVHLGTLCFVDFTPRPMDAGNLLVVGNLSTMLVKNLERDLALTKERDDNDTVVTNMNREFEKTMDMMERCIMFVDPTPGVWKVLYTNQAWEKVSGLPKSEAVGKHTWDLFENPNGTHVGWSNYSQAIKEGREFAIERLVIKGHKAKAVNLKFRLAQDNALAPGLAGGLPSFVLEKGAIKHNYFVAVEDVSTATSDDSATYAALTKHAERVEGLELFHIIGKGAFGSVYYGQWHGTPVAVKMIENRVVGKVDQHGTSLEALLGQELDHPNIVKTIKCVMRAPAGTTTPSGTTETGAGTGTTGTTGTTSASGGARGGGHSGSTATTTTTTTMMASGPAISGLQTLSGGNFDFDGMLGEASCRHTPPAASGSGLPTIREAAPTAPAINSSSSGSTVVGPLSPAGSANQLLGSGAIRSASGAGTGTGSGSDSSSATGTPPFLSPTMHGTPPVPHSGSTGSRPSAGTPGGLPTITSGDYLAGDGSSLRPIQPSYDSGDSGETWLVLEFCDKGTLQDALDKALLKVHTGSGHWEPHLPSIIFTASEIAAAMEYLHSKGVVHGDLTAWNIMLASPPGSAIGSGGSQEQQQGAADPHNGGGGSAAGVHGSHDSRGFIAKVADFGLSRSMDMRSKIKTRTYGTITHMPPEVLISGIISKAADVYSFGVLLWQMYTSARPWAGMNHGQIMYNVGMKNLQLVFPDHTPPELSELSCMCTHMDPAQRPTFEAVSRRLEMLKTQ